MAFIKKKKMTCDIKKVAFTTLKVMKNSQLMDYMVSLHFIHFISGVFWIMDHLFCLLLGLALG
jgi:hypothetical protein